MFLVCCQNDLQAKDSPLEDVGNVSGKQTNVRLSQSVHTKTKTQQKSVKYIFSYPWGLKEAGGRNAK